MFVSILAVTACNYSEQSIHDFCRDHADNEFCRNKAVTANHSSSSFDISSSSDISLSSDISFSSDTPDSTKNGNLLDSIDNLMDSIVENRKTTDFLICQLNLVYQVDDYSDDALEMINALTDSANIDIVMKACENMDEVLENPAKVYNSIKPKLLRNSRDSLP